MPGQIAEFLQDLARFGRALWAVIWNPITAAWMQALGTIAAVWFSAKLARDAHEREQSARKRELRVKGGAVALRILPYLEGWRSNVSPWAGRHTPEYTTVRIMLEQLSWYELCPPHEVIDALEHLGDYGDVVEPITCAIFDYRRIATVAESARNRSLEIRRDSGDVAEADTRVFDEISRAADRLHEKVNEAIRRIDALDPARTKR